MATKEERDHALQKAIDEAGGPNALAEFITEKYGEITAQAVCGWKRCPPGRALQVEHATGGKVSRYELCPDTFGEPPKRKARAAA